MSPHTKNLIRFASFAGLVVPPTALAAMMLQLPADAIAGLGFDVFVTGATRNQAVTVQMDTPDGGTVKLRGTADANGETTLTAKGSATQRAGTYGFDDGSSLEVLPDAIDPVLSTIDVYTPRIEPDGDDAASVTVTLRDQYGNPLPGRIVTLVSGREDDDVEAETNETDGDGEQHFTVRSYAPGTVTLRAIDLLSGITLVDSATVRSGDGQAMGGREESDDRGSRMVSGSRYFYAAQVADFDVIDRFDIDAPSTLPLGEEASKITIRAVDKSGNTVEDYTGTVEFSATDKDATLPNFGRYTFKDRDLGKKDFPLVLKFKQPGKQGFRVEDQNDRTIFGNVDITVIGDDGPVGGEIAITSPKDGDTVGATTVTVVGTGPKFTNIVVLGGASDVPGSTDADGAFSVVVPLRADQRDYTIRVQDEDKRFDSGPVLIHVDAEGPSISDVSFNPEEPTENEKVLVVAKSEAGLKSIVMTITQPATNAVQEIVLKPAATSGSYQAFFTAPQPDEYKPKLVAVDAAGNSTELLTTLTVGSPALGVPKDVVAEPRVNAVGVSWTEIDEEVTGYRVYVGEKPSSFGYFLDTEKPVGKATIAGLTPGKQYYFAVTALQGDRESDKSLVAGSTVLGLSLRVIPQDQALQLVWTKVDADTPLSHFLLEYGLDESTLTETRLINRELTEFILRDLINGVPYTLRLTPVTAAGKKLTDLSVVERGTPNGEGFRPAAGDPIPFDIDVPPGGLDDHPPEVPKNGIPRSAVWISVGVAAAGVIYEVRRRAERNRTRAFLASLPHVR